MTRLEWLLGALRIALAPVCRGGLLLVVLVFAAIVGFHSDFVPYWDAMVYFNCIAEAVQKPFDLLNFRCVGHPSVVYFLLLGLMQHLAPWNVSLAYAANVLLGGASIIAFHALLRLLFPNRAAGECVLVTALYAFAPLFLVHALFLNPDYGMTAFFVLFLYFVMARRFWWASVFAVAMMLSKEAGAAAYAVTVSAYVLAFIIRAPLSRKERLAALRLLAPLTAAPFALAMYVVAVHMRQPDSGSWVSAYLPLGIIRDRLDLILNTNLADAGIRSFLADIFILNFQWLYTAVLIAALSMVVAAAHSGEGPVTLVSGKGLFFPLVLVGLVYVVTRYHDYNNARYVLIVSPLLIVTFYGALLAVFPRVAVRRLFLSVAVVLVFLSNFRTLDFGSKAAFGTIHFGRHRLLDMPSIVRGVKLDSIVYNLESLQFYYLLSDMMKDLRPAPHTVFFTGVVPYYFPPLVDERSYALTANSSHALPLSILSSDGDVRREVLRTHVTGNGDRFFYLAFGISDNHLLQLLLQQYPLAGSKRYDRNGYTLDVYYFRFTSAS